MLNFWKGTHQLILAAMIKAECQNWEITNKISEIISSNILNIILTVACYIHCINLIMRGGTAPMEYSIENI